MWARIKDAAIALLGRQRITFEESTEVLVGETISDIGLADPAMVEFMEVVQSNIPNGCACSFHIQKPRIVFFAGISRLAISQAEELRGMKIAA